MKLFRNILIFYPIILFTSCDEDITEIDSAIIGRWQFLEIYKGIDTGWSKVDSIPIQILEFSSNGDYHILADDKVTCDGHFLFETDTTIRMIPNDCMPRIKSVETIKRLTSDTLEITNTSNSLSSFIGRTDKYYKID